MIRINKKGEDYLYLVISTMAYLILALILYAVIKSSLFGSVILEEEWEQTRILLGEADKVDNKMLFGYSYIEYDDFAGVKMDTKKEKGVFTDFQNKKFKYIKLEKEKDEKQIK
jgi:hypothetical protein